MKHRTYFESLWLMRFWIGWILGWRKMKIWRLKILSIWWWLLWSPLLYWRRGTEHCSRKGGLKICTNWMFCIDNFAFLQSQFNIEYVILRWKYLYPLIGLASCQHWVRQGLIGITVDKAENMQFDTCPTIPENIKDYRWLKHNSDSLEQMLGLKMRDVFSVLIINTDNSITHRQQSFASSPNKHLTRKTLDIRGGLNWSSLSETGALPDSIITFQAQMLKVRNA